MCRVDARLTPLWSLVRGLNLLLAQQIDDDAACCAVVAKRLQRALSLDWLPAEARRGADERYQRHLLYQDPAERFSIGSFVWKPGQETPVHDHTGWGVIGVIEGELVSENFEANSLGCLTPTSTVVLRPGVTTWLFPGGGDIHRIANRSARMTATSIHVYGAPFTSVCRNQYLLPAGAPDTAALPTTTDGIAPAQAQLLRNA